MSIFIITAVLLAAIIYTSIVYAPLPWGQLANAALGALLGAAIISLELRIRTVAALQVAGGFIGAVLGVILALLVGIPLAKIPMGDSAQAFWQSLVLLFLAYLGLLLGLKKTEWFDPLSVVAYFRGTTTVRSFKILDTSVIIDGRVADICETGFMDGTMVIPQFVLKELQQVADSLKRNRGRRGLDILQKIRKMSGIDVNIFGGRLSGRQRSRPEAHRAG